MTKKYPFFNGFFIFNVLKLINSREVVSKVFDELAKKYETRDGGYTRIIKLKERRGDDALEVRLELV